MNPIEQRFYGPFSSWIPLLLSSVLLLDLSALPIHGQGSSTLTAPRILYVEKGDSRQNFLTVINPDGTGGKRVSPGFFVVVSPRTCQIHATIVFTVHSEAMRTSVYLLHPEGRTEKVIDNAAAFGWSPDGKFVLYAPSGQECDLFTYALSTKKSERLTKGKQVVDAGWSRDMKTIVLSIMEKTGSFDLYLYAVQSKSLEKLTNTPQVTEFSPAFAAEGKEILYTHQPFKGLEGNGPGWMEKIEIASRQVTPLQIAGISVPSLSPDGNWIVFEENEGTDQIGICRIDGSSRAVLSARGSNPTWIQ